MHSVRTELNFGHWAGVPELLGGVWEAPPRNTHTHIGIGSRNPKISIVEAWNKVGTEEGFQKWDEKACRLRRQCGLDSVGMGNHRYILIKKKALLGENYPF